MTGKCVSPRGGVDHSSIIKVAYGSVPKDGGTFTFYRNLRPALLRAGIDLRCVTVGQDQSDLVQPEFVDDGCVLLAAGSRNSKRQARAFADWCEAESVDIVMGINSEGILSSLPHLPEAIRVVARCANGFDEGYRVTLSCKDRLARIVALVPKLRDDLNLSYGVDKKSITLIPNGIAPGPFSEAAGRRRGADEHLEMGFVGRLEHEQKGVLYLPGIVRELERLEVPFRLRIAGKGRHEAKLRGAMAAEVEAGRVEFVGPIGPAEVPKFLAGTDVFAFTSHFEGCPNALLEAMMAGAVPVSWRLPGITDFLIDHGRTGFLCETTHTERFASHVEVLAADRDLTARMSVEVAAEARARFTDGICADAYASLFKRVMVEPPPPWTPRQWAEFQPDENFPNTWRRLIPARYKTSIRRVINSPKRIAMEFVRGSGRRFDG